MRAGTSESEVQRVQHMMPAAIDNAMSSLLIDLQREANIAALRQYIIIVASRVTDSTLS